MSDNCPSKTCASCGAVFYKHPKYSRTQWESCLYCSLQCAGKSKEGKPRSEGTKKKLSKAHKGTKKPWAGKYQRKPEHREAIRAGLQNMGDDKKEEVSRKLSEAHKGRKWTDEARENAREAQKRRPNYKGGEKTRNKRRAFYQRRREAKKSASGSHTLRDWERIKRGFNYTCPSCLLSEPEITLTEDHIIPISLGGTDDADNIQPLCHPCNSSKHVTQVSYLPPWPNQEED